MPHDCIILGGGPAGLAAGVYLGRYRRSTLILDYKKPMTLWHRPIAHNVLGYPAGIHRNQLLDWGRAHVALYECVEIERTTIVEIAKEGDLFVLKDEDGKAYQSRGLILAPGVEYELPDIPDVMAYAGRTLWHCPECDGYKCLDKQVAVIGKGKGSAEMALGLTIWARKVTLCTNGEAPGLDEEALKKLRAAKIDIIEKKIVRLRGDKAEGVVEALEFDDGGTLEIFGAFANEGCSSCLDLLKGLGLEFHKERWIKVDHRMRTNVARCYAAGDIIANAQTQLSVAMGTGATAAIWLHKELLPAGLCLTDHGW